MCRGIGVQWYVPCTFPSARQPDSQQTDPQTVPPCMCECVIDMCCTTKLIIVPPMQQITRVMHHDSSNGTQCLLSPGSACSVLSSRI